MSIGDLNKSNMGGSGGLKRQMSNHTCQLKFLAVLFLGRSPFRHAPNPGNGKGPVWFCGSHFSLERPEEEEGLRQIQPDS